MNSARRNSRNRAIQELNERGSFSTQLRKTWLIAILGVYIFITNLFILNSIFLGTIGFFSGIILIFWNEAQAVANSKTLEDAVESVTPLYDTAFLDKTLEGKLLHLTGTIMVQEPLTEVDYGVSVMAVKLKRRVQMYQWVEEDMDIVDDNLQVITTDYHYFTEWKDSLIDSNLFHSTMSHWNPKEIPIKNQVQVSEKVTVGAYELSPELKEQFKDYVEVTSDERPERKDIKLHSGLYYHSVDVWNPEIGDVRIQFSYAGPQGQTVTIAARLDANGILIPHVSKTGQTFLFVKPGSYSIDGMFALLNGRNRLRNWCFRGLSWAIIHMSCFFLSSVIRALFIRSRTLRQLIPNGSLKIITSMSISLLMTSLAWMWYRPLLGFVLIAVSFLLLLWTRYNHGGNDHSGYRSF